MKLLDVLEGIIAGAVTGVAAVTVLPVFGAVGAITATGTVVAATGGAVLGAIDKINGD